MPDTKRHRLAGVVDELRGARHSIIRGHDFWLSRQGGQPRPSLVAAPVPQQAREGAAPNRVLRERPESFQTVPGRVAGGTLAFHALDLKSAYSFWDSVLTIPSLNAAAVERSVSAVAITDPNLHGAVEFYQAAKAAGLQPIIGAELSCEGRRWNAYVENRQGYENLCGLLSRRVAGELTRGELRESSPGLSLMETATAALPIPLRTFTNRHRRKPRTFWSVPRSMSTSIPFQ